MMKLCYVDPRTRIMYFSETPVEQVWGDDWNDAPWEHNAGSPYSSYGPFKRLLIDSELDLPGEGMTSSPYSVQAINDGRIVPWLRSPTWSKSNITVWAGADYDEVVKVCRQSKTPYMVDGQL